MGSRSGPGPEIEDEPKGGIEPLERGRVQPADPGTQLRIPGATGAAPSILRI